ncbi:MAG: hypothetical protein LBR49_05525, partial [Tannerella sp.]|nr:hypothetical protein [Tannerella sp.]
MDKKNVLLIACAFGLLMPAVSVEAQIKLAVDAKSPQEIISPLLFGHNIEHTRSAVYYGLSAQVLRNRKFAGKPTGYFGGPVEWKRYGSLHTFINLVPPLAYTKHNCKTRGNRGAEINAISLQNPVEGVAGGIQQYDLPL